jgi:hypothetical protein
MAHAFFRDIDWHLVENRYRVLSLNINRGLLLPKPSDQSIQYRDHVDSDMRVTFSNVVEERQPSNKTYVDNWSFVGREERAINSSFSFRY